MTEPKNQPCVGSLCNKLLSKPRYFIYLNCQLLLKHSDNLAIGSHIPIVIHIVWKETLVGETFGKFGE